MSLAIVAEDIHAFHRIEPSEYTESLESQFLEQICTPLDLNFKGFEDFLEPNETEPEKIKPHLDRMAPGIIVSTGTERSFFDLLLSDENRCSGLVIRDINPRAKAYADFLILALRLSNSREEFIDLLSSSYSEDEKIKQKIQETTLPNKLKQYYLDNFSELRFQYMKGSHIFRGRLTSDSPGKNYFSAVNYFNHDDHFYKLKRYADNGKIIATVGDIGDLEFLREQPISVVDTSNIQDYIILNLRGARAPFQPRVIWTGIHEWGHASQWAWDYRSYVHEPLTTEQKEKIDTLFARVVLRAYPDQVHPHLRHLKFLSAADLELVGYPKEPIYLMERDLQNRVLIESQKDEYNHIAPSSYSRRLLDMLETKVQELPADDPIETEKDDDAYPFYPDDDDVQISDYGSAGASDDDALEFSFEDE